MTTSPPSARASSMANRDFPDPVGPTTTITRGGDGIRGDSRAQRARKCRASGRQGRGVARFRDRSRANLNASIDRGIGRPIDSIAPTEKPIDRRKPVSIDRSIDRSNPWRNRSIHARGCRSTDRSIEPMAKPIDRCTYRSGSRSERGWTRAGCVDAHSSHTSRRAGDRDARARAPFGNDRRESGRDRSSRARGDRYRGRVARGRKRGDGDRGTNARRERKRRVTSQSCPPARPGGT